MYLFIVNYHTKSNHIFIYALHIPSPFSSFLAQWKDFLYWRSKDALRFCTARTLRGSIGHFVRQTRSRIDLPGPRSRAESRHWTLRSGAPDPGSRCRPQHEVPQHRHRRPTKAFEDCRQRHYYTR